MSNEIKKALYKEKPIAEISSVSKSGIVYVCYSGELQKPLAFLVPLNDIGDVLFAKEMNAQLLIRYLVTQ